MKTAILVLAAGASSRMGCPKQLLPYGRTSLLGHVIEAARMADCGPVYVVTGANETLVRPIVDQAGAEAVHNPEWELGPGASIRAGVAALRRTTPHGVLILLADQPLIGTELIARFIKMAAVHPGRIIAAAYDGIVGVPAFFPAALYDALQQLDPGRGAKPMLERYGDLLVPVALPENPDLDTMEAYHAALQAMNMH